MLSELLAIRSTPAQIAIQTQRGGLIIEQRMADMAVSTPSADLSITRTPPRLEIDSTIPRQEMGYYQMLGLLHEIVAYTGRQFERAVADIVAQGDALQRIEDGGGAIAQLAWERMFVDMNDRVFVLTAIPCTPPAIRFTPGQLLIQTEPRRARIQIIAQPPMISVQAPEVRVEATWPELRFFLRAPGVLDLTV